MPRISVVVPIYNVESYLTQCLESIAGQTFGDLEVIMVDDGSTDGSTEIAREFAARDDRFRLITQANGGLGKARNTGADAATGEFLSFVDSDDALMRNAYTLLLGALDETGSDYASGNVHRLTRHATVQAPFLARVFRETQLRTHVTQFRQMLVDRIVPNKLWRRSFWDEHGLRFPEGMLHEDIPVVLPAMFLAKSVDLISDPIYLYRVREGESRSITQRRAEPKALLDRIAAVKHVSDFLATKGPKEFKEGYDASVVREDLRYYLNVLEVADESYRELFLDKVNEFLDRVDPKAFEPLAAIERLKWHLVRRRLMPEVLEVLRFQREDITETPPIREGGRWYGDYPFRGDARLAVPDEIYRIEAELKPVIDIEDVRFEDGQLRVAGWAFIGGIGAPEEGSQRVEVTALRPGRLARLRLLTSGLRFKTRGVHRPDVTSIPRQQLADLSWTGFVATVDARKLRRPGTWNLYVTVRAGGLKRRRMDFWVDAPRAFGASVLETGDDVLVTAAPTPEGGVTVQARDAWAIVRDHRVADGAVELSGDLRRPGAGKLVLQVAREDGVVKQRYKVGTGDGDTTFSVRIPMAELLAQSSPDPEDDDGLGMRWTLQLTGGGGPRLPLTLPRETGEAVWPADGREVALVRTRQGDAALDARDPSPVITAARWDDDALELSGNAAEGVDELVLFTRGRGEVHPFPLGRDGRNGHFQARLTPASITTLAGKLPLRAAVWEVRARAAGDDAGATMAPVVVADGLLPQMPVERVIDRKRMTLARTADARAILTVGRDLDDEERGRFNQRRLRSTAYTAQRDAPLLDAVVYSSFAGRQYSDNPRAIHEELVRRGSPLEHLWVVHDARCIVPDGARAVREGSRAYHEVLARARYVVTNDHFPEWFVRREDQVCVQTWHGTPLKQLGFDASTTQKVVRRFERYWERQIPNWQYVVSPNRFATPILQRAYRLEGEMLETGYPRNDVFARPDREELARRVRERLGIPEGKRTVLYAPTFRDNMIDRQSFYRLDLQLDLERLRDALGPDTVLLFRKHHYIVDPVPATADGFVRDVSAYPDGTELLLAADVLLTDYSSMMFDFANTGRPMMFFTYDLEDYADRIRGFYFDFAEVAPGPLLRTSDEVAEALRDPDAVRTEYAERYDAFARRFCELDDGRAAARVVDRVFGT